MTQVLIPPDCATVSWFCVSAGERRDFSGGEISELTKVGLQSFAPLMSEGSLMWTHHTWHCLSEN